VVVLEPTSKLVHHLVEDSSAASIGAGSDVVDVFIETMTAGTVISDSGLPFREETIDPTASGDVFR
jgi:hypothetical protein